LLKDIDPNRSQGFEKYVNEKIINQDKTVEVRILKDKIIVGRKDLIRATVFFNGESLNEIFAYRHLK